MHEMQAKILIADDDRFVRSDLGDLLETLGARLIFAATAKETWEKVMECGPELVLLDLKFPDCTDLSLLRRIRAEALGTEVIMISSQTEAPQIVEAIKLGAYDYVPKPFVAEELLNRVRKALSLRTLARTQAELLKEVQRHSGIDCLIGDGPEMGRVRENIRRFADADGCVMIHGESGTGKELAARALHYLGKRRSSPFVVINCAAIPETLVESILFGHRRGAFTGAVESAKGQLEAAEDGTVFLDEIGDMPLPQQASLLRVLEYCGFTPLGENREKECRARFVLATNRDLRACVRDGQFREDLFYRVNVASISMPALRDRPEDIRQVSEYYCRRLSAEMGRSEARLHPDLLALFMKYDWPGNVRELRNMLEGMIMLVEPKTTELCVEHVPSELLGLRGETPPLKLTLRERTEKQQLTQVLRDCHGNQSQAASMLGWHRNTVRSKIRYYGIC